MALEIMYGNAKHMCSPQARFVSSWILICGGGQDQGMSKNDILDRREPLLTRVKEISNIAKMVLVLSIPQYSVQRYLDIWKLYGVLSNRAIIPATTVPPDLLKLSCLILSSL